MTQDSSSSGRTSAWIRLQTKRSIPSTLTGRACHSSRSHKIHTHDSARLITSSITHTQSSVTDTLTIQLAQYTNKPSLACFLSTYRIAQYSRHTWNNNETHSRFDTYGRSRHLRDRERRRGILRNRTTLTTLVYTRLSLPFKSFNNDIYPYYTKYCYPHKHAQ